MKVISFIVRNDRKEHFTFDMTLVTTKNIFGDFVKKKTLKVGSYEPTIEGQSDGTKFLRDIKKTTFFLCLLAKKNINENSGNNSSDCFNVNLSALFLYFITLK